MSRLPGLLVLVLVALVAFQTWQTLQLRRDLAGRGVPLLSVRGSGSAGKVTQADLKIAGRKFSAAAQAARRGDAAAARSAGDQACALIEPGGTVPVDIRPLEKELAQTREFLEQQLHGLYRPANKENAK